jgi:hypothetical protein
LIFRERGERPLDVTRTCLGAGHVGRIVVLNGLHGGAPRQ